MENLDLSKFKLEHTECDFKREVEHKKTKSWLKSVSAFANGIGGALIFGIDDENRQYCPIADLQGEIEFITECIKDRISPIPEFVLKPDTVNGNTVLVLTVSGGLNTPYYPCSSTVQADTPILHELILKGTNRTWDTLKSEYEAKNFSFTYFESLNYNRTGKRIEPQDYFSFGLKTKEGFLTNAGALFTDVCPFFHSRIFCTRWNGLTKAPSSYDAIDDKESFPERAIHEAMVNALVHRDYGVLGSEIHIDIFDDRLVIQNPGGMYDGIPVQNQELENVVSTRRNPVIADLLTRMDFMERRGSGFRKILDAVKFAPNYTEENLPVFNSNPYSFSVTFKNMNYGVEPIETVNSQKTGEKEAENTRKDGVSEQIPKDFPKTSQRLPKELPEGAQKTFEAIILNPHAKLPELSASVGVSERSIKTHISILKKEGLIERVGGKTYGYWKVNDGN